MMEEDFPADLTWIRAYTPPLVHNWPRFSSGIFLSAVLLFSVQVQLRGAPENHVTRAALQKLLF